MTMRQTILGLVAIVSYLLPLSFASAHEVYVLDPDTIRAAMATTSPNTFLAYFGNESQFFFWACISIVTMLTILFATAFGIFEHSLGPVFSTLRRCALPLARITAGVSVISFGIAGALYGTEIPFSSLFGPLSDIFQLILVAVGAAITLGLCTRPLSLLLTCIYAYAGLVYGWYIFTYTDHLGVYLLLLIVGGGTLSLDRTLPTLGSIGEALLEKYRPYAFPILRTLFGFGIMFASVYAKYLHSELALQVVVQYNLTNYFPFDPMFIVLGALIIEFLAGLMLVLGVAIRWTSLFLLFWLTLSLLYFQEAVWPHIILFGLGISIFLYGYDQFSLEMRWMKKRHREPVM